MSTLQYDKRFFPPRFEDPDLTKTFRAVEEEFSRIAKVINVNIGAHEHDAAEIISGTFDDARIAESNVTQHEAAIDHDALDNYVSNEHIDWTNASENLKTSGWIQVDSAGIAQIIVDSYGADAFFGLQLDNVTKWTLGFDNTDANAFKISEGTPGTNTRLKITTGGAITAGGTLSIGTITVINGSSINLQEDITFTGSTAQNLIKFPDNLPTALDFREAANSYLKFVTSNGGEGVTIGKALTLSSIAAGAADYDKFLVSHTGLIKYRTGAQVLSDLSGDAGAAFSWNGQNLTGVGTIGCNIINLSDGSLMQVNGNDFIWYHVEEENFAIGLDALENVTEGSGLGNLAIGNEAGFSVTTTDKNIFIGKKAGYGCDSGYNIIIGFEAGLNMTATGTGGNVLVGANCATALTTGYYNVIFGFEAGNSITIRYGNICVGYRAGYSTNVNYGVYIGHEAGYYETGGQNVYIGAQAGKGTTGYGLSNVLVGHRAGWKILDGDDNTGLGGFCFDELTTGLRNTALGGYALHEITTGDNHVAVGKDAGYSVSTANACVFLGYQAGYSETGSNKLYISNSNTATPLIYGDFDKGNIGFGIATFGTNAEKVIALPTGVDPTSSPPDCFQMYSADIVADHAAMHIRNENDTIIKLYQQALIADPAGQVNDLDSEARTAIDAILDLLENNGLMANA